MPALPPVPNVAQIEFLWTVGTDVDVTTKLSFLYSGDPPDTASVVDIADAAATAWAAHLQALMTTGNVLQSIQVTDLNSADGERFIAAVGENGTASGAALTQQVCALVNHVLTARYRGGKPRSYFPWGTESSLLNQAQWSSAYITAVNSGFAAFIGALLGETFDTTTFEHQVAISYYSGVYPPVTLPSGRVKQASKPRATPVVYPITESRLNPKLGTQRRRVAA
jgi:hypothetical protein